MGVDRTACSCGTRDRLFIVGISLIVSGPFTAAYDLTPRSPFRQVGVKEEMR